MASRDKVSWRWLVLLLFIFISVFCLTRYFIANNVVSGNSMQPTLRSGERLISLKHQVPKRSDIVVLAAPDQPGALYIKRVIGMPGDTVVVKNDQLYINGKRRPEPYLHTDFARREFDVYADRHHAEHFTADFSLAQLAATHAQRVPAHSYFVMGDNRLISNDGRAFGFVTQQQITSVVLWRYWPFNAAKHF